LDLDECPNSISIDFWKRKRKKKKKFRKVRTRKNKSAIQNLTIHAKGCNYFFATCGFLGVKLFPFGKIAVFDFWFAQQTK
jgi:hypothetical protein